MAKSDKFMGENMDMEQCPICGCQYFTEKKSDDGRLTWLDTLEKDTLTRVFNLAGALGMEDIKNLPGLNGFLQEVYNRVVEAKHHCREAYLTLSGQIF